jgi:hypothetical protein
LGIIMEFRLRERGSGEFGALDADGGPIGIARCGRSATEREDAEKERDGKQRPEQLDACDDVGAAVERRGPVSDDAGLDPGDIVRGVGDEVKEPAEHQRSAIDATRIAGPRGPRLG